MLEIVLWSEVVVKIAPSLSFTCLTTDGDEVKKSTKPLAGASNSGEGFGVFEKKHSEIDFANPMGGGGGIQMNPFFLGDPSECSRRVKVNI